MCARPSRKDGWRGREEGRWRRGGGDSPIHKTEIESPFMFSPYKNRFLSSPGAFFTLSLQRGERRRKKKPTHAASSVFPQTGRECLFPPSPRRRFFSPLGHKKWENMSGESCKSVFVHSCHRGGGGVTFVGSLCLHISHFSGGGRRSRKKSREVFCLSKDLKDP